MFTSTTIRKLRALNLPQETFDAVLQIFEEATLSKPKRKGSAEDKQKRGTRLPDDWQLPADYADWAVRLGLTPREVQKEAGKFKNYWLNRAGAGGMKLRWELTWQTWCRKALEFLGRDPKEPEGGGPAPKPGPDGFDDKTWQAIVARIKSGSPWNPEWGPPPDRMDCRMPEKYLGAL